MMTRDDKSIKEDEAVGEGGIEYRATIRIPKKDYEFMQKLIETGEYTNITEIVRDAVKRFRLEWSDVEAMQKFMPMMSARGRMMPLMRQMCQQMSENNKERKGGG